MAYFLKGTSMALKIGRIVAGYVQTNVYFVYDENDKKAVVFDPADDGKGIYDKLNASGISVVAIFLTHGHFDHIYGVKELKELTDVKVYASADEDDVLKDAELNVSAQTGRQCTVVADVLLKDGEETDIEGMKIKMIATPGHTKGSCCFYFEEAGFLICGDTLFLGSCGRTDLPTGSSATLDRSIREKLMVLPDEVRIFPGHGDASTIGFERETNPFC